MKNIIYNIFTLYGISNALAYSNTSLNLSDMVERSFTLNGKTGTGLCEVNLLKYVDCFSSLNKAALGKDLTSLDSSKICPVYEEKCKDFINDTFNYIDCDRKLGEMTKYSVTFNRLYYLTNCIKDSNGNACPITKVVNGEEKLTIKNSGKVLEDSCKDENCNKSFVAMADIIDKNIDNKLLYDQFINFTNDISYKSLALSFRNKKCDSINVITSNKEVFNNAEELYNNIINLFYRLSMGKIPDYSIVLDLVNKSKNFLEGDVSENCLNQFKNYSKCFDSFKYYNEENIENSNDVSKMCKKFEGNDCDKLINDLKSNDIQCNNTNINDVIYKAIFISLRFTYLSACSKTENDKDLCPISNYLQTEHKFEEATKDFLTAITENCENNYCNDKFYIIKDLIKDSNIYDQVIRSDINFDDFFKNLKNHTCKSFKIGLGIFEIIEDVIDLIREIMTSALDSALKLLNGVLPDYSTIRNSIINLNKKFNIFGVNKECLSQVWSYSSCVNLFISDESYNNIHNITSSEVCAIFEDKNCNSFITDLMNTDFKCININNSNEEIYKKIYDSLKFTYLSTCSKTENEDDYCPMVEYMNSNMNITEDNLRDYENALKSTCEDKSCNKSYSEVYKILHEGKEENKEYSTSTAQKREMVISEGEIELDQAIKFLDNNQCIKFSKAMTNQNVDVEDNGFLLTKVNIFTILFITTLTMITLF
ncbi:hypothetical protein BCR36DRAFT_320824 [Piromyces finnis]|uniref:Uncharacterized protein n=1 Tax=Piromyces finnis TaxID=1754191 RepID=A0A1Y1VI73_9FUNG|nr:hypothetical protein BCR36DRAFT_320824 [Piromyces finnis]|eukprot:ORX56033.1 hypothetical protein BCR36DRAFT_320824 [Piromyces finnis]